jgi:aspartate racemase
MSEPILGILGGMGPLASAQFVQLIYELNLTDHEQQMPRVLLDSDPGFPDRTEAIHTGRLNEMVNLLTTRLARLTEYGATRTVVACTTAHYFLAFVEPALRNRTISLIDTALTSLLTRPGKFLLLATSGTCQAEIFQHAPTWPSVADRVVVPDRHDQNLIHELIYQIKRGQASDQVIPTIEPLRARYNCSGLILGCTEFHLHSRQLAAHYGSPNIIDPLWSIATNLDQYLAAPPPLRKVS